MNKRRYNITLEPNYWNDKLNILGKRYNSKSKSQTLKKIIDSIM